jgi:hypothetical protein
MAYILCYTKNYNKDEGVDRQLVSFDVNNSSCSALFFEWVKVGRQPPSTNKSVLKGAIYRMNTRKIGRSREEAKK